METSDQIDLAEDTLAREVGREIVDARDWVTVVFGDAVEPAVISARPQPPPGLGATCNGEENGLLERRMMPSSSIVLNSLLAMTSFSGDNLLAWARTGGPLVTMWCWTPCLGVPSRAKVGVVSSGLSWRSAL